MIIYNAIYGIAEQVMGFNKICSLFLLLHCNLKSLIIIDWKRSAFTSCDRISPEILARFCRFLFLIYGFTSNSKEKYLAP